MLLRMICLVDGCTEKALYNFKHLKPQYCKNHKENDMVTKPNQYCQHDKRKTQCVQCNGAAICQHGKQKYQCKECKPTIDDVAKGMAKVQIAEKEPSLCIDCNTSITPGALRCDTCNRKLNSKVKDRPSLKQLIKDINEIQTFTVIGRKYNVNDNTIRKWLKDYNYESKCFKCKKPVKSFGKLCSDCKLNK